MKILATFCLLLSILASKPSNSTLTIEDILSLDNNAFLKWLDTTKQFSNISCDTDTPYKHFLLLKDIFKQKNIDVYDSVYLTCHCHVNKKYIKKVVGPRLRSLCAVWDKINTFVSLNEILYVDDVMLKMEHNYLIIVKQAKELKENLKSIKKDRCRRMVNGFKSKQKLTCKNKL